MNTLTKQVVEAFAKRNKIEGLSRPSLIAVIDEKPGYSVEKSRAFLNFQYKINHHLLKHRIITNNDFTRWFKQGELHIQHLKDFVIQFSVFSNLFLIAQLQKTINADTLEGMRASKEILANEIGVIFQPTNVSIKAHENHNYATDPELVSTEGSVEGGTFRFRAAHFEWLLRMAEKLELTFNDIGKRRHGTASTLFFCDELIRLYGSDDYLTSQAASYAVENWAAAGFWDELVEGFSRYNERTKSDLPLAFFTWHSRIEAQHASHTQEELEDIYFTRNINEDTFIQVGNEMLDGVATFWNGLDQQRKQPPI